MNKPTLIYCYDAYCGWCYGFSPVIKRIAEQYKNEFYIEVLSGGMMIGDGVMPIEKIGPYIQGAYKRVEELTAIKFGEDFLWHINNPDKSDWVMNSEKPAIALCVFKDYFPDEVTSFPQVLLQQSDSKFYLISKGFSDYKTINLRIQNVLKEITPPSKRE